MWNVLWANKTPKRQSYRNQSICLLFICWTDFYMIDTLAPLLLIWTYLTPFSSVFIVDFEQVNVCRDKATRTNKRLYISSVNSFQLTSLTSFWCLYCYLRTDSTYCSGVSIIDFEQVNVGWVDLVKTTLEDMPMKSQWNLCC